MTGIRPELLASKFFLLLLLFYFNFCLEVSLFSLTLFLFLSAEFQILCNTNWFCKIKIKNSVTNCSKLKIRNWYKFQNERKKYEKLQNYFQNRSTMQTSLCDIYIYIHNCRLYQHSEISNKSSKSIFKKMRIVKTNNNKDNMCERERERM